MQIEKARGPHTHAQERKREITSYTPKYEGVVSGNSYCRYLREREITSYTHKYEGVASGNSYCRNPIEMMEHSAKHHERLGMEVISL